MIRPLPRFAAAAWAAGLVALLPGCRTTPPPTFYRLVPLPQSTPALSGAAQLRLGIGPVELPHYLDRSQLVTAAGRNQLFLEEFHQWAEPLAGNIRRVLAENLATLLDTDRVSQFPWKRGTEVDYQIVVDILGFEGQPGGEGVLTARWSIIDGAGLTVAPPRRQAYARPTAGPGHTELVAALNEALEGFCRDVAGTVRSLPGPGAIAPPG